MSEVILLSGNAGREKSRKGNKMLTARNGARSQLYRVSGEAMTMMAIEERTGKSAQTLRRRIAKIRATGQPVTWEVL